MVENLVAKHLSELNESDLYIWRYVAAHRRETVNLTLAELARRCNASKSSVLRFCQKLSFAGFSEFRYALKSELDHMGPSAAEPVQLTKRYGQAISKTLSDMLSRDFTPIFQLIDQSEKVFLYGTGTLQRMVAREMRRVFLTGGEYFYVIEGVDEIDALASTLTSNDMVFIISQQGRSDNARSFAELLNARGVPFVSITSFLDNDISHLSSERIFVNLDDIELGDGKSYRVCDPYFMLVSILFMRYEEYRARKDPAV